MDHDTSGWLPVVVTCILLICTWIANCILLGGALQTATTGNVIPVTYFFVSSQAIGALVHVTLNLPPAILERVFSSKHIGSYNQIFCLYSTYLDAFFCNIAFLQTFFSSLDAYLRLRNPIFYLSSAKRRPALWLKIGSPWLVAAVQSVGQIALSDRNKIHLHRSLSTTSQYSILRGFQTICLLPDPNFLIIRTVIAYAMPLIACIVLVGLQLIALRNTRNYSIGALKALIQMRTSKAKSPSQSNMECKSIESTAVKGRVVNSASLQSITIRTLSKENSQMSLVPVLINDTRLTKLNEAVSTVNQATHTRDSCLELTNDSILTALTVRKKPYISSPGSRQVLVHNFDRINVTIQDQACPTIATLSTFGANTIKKPERPSTSEHHPLGETYYSTLRSDVKIADLSVIRQPELEPVQSEQSHEMVMESLSSCSSLWLQAYNGEQISVAINLVGCIIAVCTWSPYILATLAHGLCQTVLIPVQANLEPNSLLIMPNHNLPSLYQSSGKQMPRCFVHVTPERVADFRWWAYASSGLLLPCLLFFLDLGLREGCWKSLIVNTERADSRPSGNCVQKLNTGDFIPIYRCDSAPDKKQFPIDGLEMEIWGKREYPCNHCNCE